MSAKLLVATGGETGVLSMIPSSNTAPGVDNIPNEEWVAKYCRENRWTLNPKTGKTEVVEFLTPPSGFTYSVSAPTRDNIKNRACIGVVQGYPYLGWWLDNALTLDDHTTQMAQKIAAASARVGRMGGRPGGLPVRTAFHLWASLALPYIHGASAL